MNYIWNILLEADEKGIDRSNIIFKQAERYSPYMEISLENLNLVDLKETSVVEVNSYYRFYEIFKDLFDINFEESLELRQVFFDIVMHFLAETDLKKGICKKHIYRQFMLSDILNNVYGEELKKNINLFSKDELYCFLDGMINLYSCNTSIYTLRRILDEVFKNNVVYINKEKTSDIYIYLAHEKTDNLKFKIEMILGTFLPISMNPLIFWDNHFGILGLDETMKIDNIIMVK